MAGQNNEQLIEHWKDEPAPLLPLLHAFHDRDGHLSEDALRAVSAALRIPLADLYGTVTFYHHFARFPPGMSAPRVCTGPVCRLVGGTELLEAMRKDGATPMACAGRCDEPIPVLTDHAVSVGATVEALQERPSPLPVANPGGLPECVFRSIRKEGRAGIAGYQKSGGYRALRSALSSGFPAAVIETVERSELAGRGGAGFPTGRKWRAVANEERGPKSVVCNADEGEPGCFKDRVLMDHDPHAVIEGMILAAYAVGASRGFIYLRYEYPQTAVILQRAIDEATEAGLLGDDILGGGLDFRIYVRRGAGAYICGEEGSLLNSLEGKHPFPRERPPYPVSHGFEDLPTVVNNVETLASVPPIIDRGGDWYRKLGLGDHAGTKVISLSGDIQRPGNYEVPIGFPLPTLLNEWAGGAPEGRTIQAVTMAGISGGFLAGDDLETTLDESSVRARGSMLGAGGIMVFDDSRDMVDVAHSCMEFFAHESCGKCFPCRIGTQRLTERLAEADDVGAAGPGDRADWAREVEDIGEVMKATSACGLGMAAPLITESLMRYWPDRVAEHVASRAS